MLSSGDDFSSGKAEEFERGLGEGGDDERKYIDSEEGDDVQKGRGYSIHTVPRARRIHQSLLTTPLSCLRCLWACLSLLFTHPHGYPDLIIINGPATSLILVLAATLFRYFSFLPFFSSHRSPSLSSGGGRKMRVIYIESWARVRRPSLSGRILVYSGLCDRVLVQWKGLEERGWGEYRGVLVR